MIELSIHLMTLNNEKYLKETIDSILEQKVNFKYEIVATDDCSTDNTFNILKTYENNYPDVFNVDKNITQLGILKNFKTTLDRCKGNYIFDIAGDDILIDKLALQKMVNILKKDEALGFIDSGYNILHENNNKIDFFKNKNLITSNPETYKNHILLGKTSTIGMCFNKHLLYKHVDFDTYLKMDITIEDYPILVDLIMNTKFTRIEESLHLYRVHDKSYSHKISFEKQYFLANQMKMLYDYFDRKYNFNNTLTNTYNITHLKQLLYYAGYYEKKEIGKDIFLKIKSKSLKDYIHYWCSQNKLFRKLVSVF